MDENQIKEFIREQLEEFISLERYTFQKHIQIFDGRHIQTGRTSGTKFPQVSDQLWGAWGKTPIDQPEAISSPSGGSTIDAEARIAIDAIRSRLQEIGLIKT